MCVALFCAPVSAPQVQLALGEARDTAERQLAAEERKKGKVGAGPYCCGMACSTHQLRSAAIAQLLCY